MTRDEVIDLLKFCKSIWPGHYAQMTRDEHYEVIDEWQKAFECISRRKVLTAIYCLSKNPTHPTIAEIITKVDETVAGIDWKRLKESYLKCGFNWPDHFEQKLKEMEKKQCIS